MKDKKAIKRKKFYIEKQLKIEQRKIKRKKENRNF